MNLRDFQYFLTVCDMGTFHAAARRLFITPQSLSERIARLEKELDIQLFYRETPLALTEAGQRMKTAAESVRATLNELERELSACRGAPRHRLRLGIADHGAPPFLPEVLERFMEAEPEAVIEIEQVSAREPVPEGLALVITPGELDSRFKNELLLRDGLVVCVADGLLRRLFGDAWEERRDRLAAGDISVLRDCPFVRQEGTPVAHWTETAFRENSFTPRYLPVLGADDALFSLCAAGRAAMTIFRGRAALLPHMPPRYPIPGIPEDIPSCYLCYPAAAPLSAPARRFADICRAVVRRTPEGAFPR